MIFQGGQSRDGMTTPRLKPCRGCGAADLGLDGEQFGDPLQRLSGGRRARGVVDVVDLAARIALWRPGRVEPTEASVRAARRKLRQPSSKASARTPLRSGE